MGTPVTRTEAGGPQFAKDPGNDGSFTELLKRLHEETRSLGHAAKRGENQPSPDRTLGGSFCGAHHPRKEIEVEIIEEVPAAQEKPQPPPPGCPVNLRFLASLDTTMHKGVIVFQEESFLPESYRALSPHTQCIIDHNIYRIGADIGRIKPEDIMAGRRYLASPGPLSVIWEQQARVEEEFNRLLSVAVIVSQRGKSPKPGEEERAAILAMVLERDSERHPILEAIREKLGKPQKGPGEILTEEVLRAIEQSQK
jgi:hypothetical protein